jgi:hypothetical protein
MESPVSIIDGEKTNRNSNNVNSITINNTNYSRTTSHGKPPIHSVKWWANDVRGSSVDATAHCNEEATPQ